MPGETVTDYGFVLDGWRPARGSDVRTEWWPDTHLGLDYIVFAAVVDGIPVKCRVDPCPVCAEAPYAEVVRRDLDHEIAKAMRAGTVRDDQPPSQRQAS